MKDELGGKVLKEFVGLKAKTYMTVVEIKNQRPQKSVSSKENLDLKIIKTVYKQLNLRIN